MRILRVAHDDAVPHGLRIEAAGRTESVPRLEPRYLLGQGAALRPKAV